jgi:hypothetical protein
LGIFIEEIQEAELMETEDSEATFGMMKEFM